MTTTPQDHKPKADAPFTFEATIKNKDGKPIKKRFTLPKMGEDAATDIPGEITYAAVMNPNDEMVQMRLAFASLEAARPSPAALDALRSLPTGEMLKVVGDWMGESSGSSD
jgi:hypothetical protein